MSISTVEGIDGHVVEQLFAAVAESSNVGRRLALALALRGYSSLLSVAHGAVVIIIMHSDFAFTER